jgi:hypothetical protein
MHIGDPWGWSPTNSAALGSWASQGSPPEEMPHYHQCKGLGRLAVRGGGGAERCKIWTSGSLALEAWDPSIAWRPGAKG